MLARLSLFASALVSAVFCDFERRPSSDHSLASTPVDERVERRARERDIGQSVRRYQRLIDTIAGPLSRVRSALELDLVHSHDDGRVQASRATLAEVAPQLRYYAAALVARFLPPEGDCISGGKHFIACMVTLNQVP